jgi:hypothetical protein
MCIQGVDMKLQKFLLPTRGRVYHKQFILKPCMFLTGKNCITLPKKNYYYRSEITRTRTQVAEISTNMRRDFFFQIQLIVIEASSYFRVFKNEYDYDAL